LKCVPILKVDDNDIAVDLIISLLMINKVYVPYYTIYINCNLIVFTNVSNIDGEMTKWKEHFDISNVSSICVIGA